MSLRIRKQFGFPTRSDTNLPVQSRKQASRGIVLLLMPAAAHCLNKVEFVVIELLHEIKQHTQQCLVTWMTALL